MAGAETNANEYLHIYFELSTQYEAHTKNLGVSYNILSALQTILEHGGDCTQRTICEYTFLPKQVVSAIATALLRHGAIRMVELDFNRRHKVIHLADRERALALGMIQKMKNAESKAMESLGKNQRETMLMAVKLYVARFRGYLLE